MATAAYATIDLIYSIRYAHVYIKSMGATIKYPLVRSYE